MGIEVKDNVYTNQLARQTRTLAKEKAVELQNLADAGRFDHGERTVDIEQEVFAIDRITGKPINVEGFMLDNALGVRPDTTVYTVEYDANGITPVIANGISELLDSFQDKTRRIQQAVSEATLGRGIVVSMGTQPLVGREYGELIVSDPAKRRRYTALDEATYERENQRKEIVIRNNETGEELRDRASNLSAMSRCAATQLHLAYPTLGETLEAYNISIAIAGPLVAMLSNSPYAGGIDTGLASSRMEMLSQAEQKRSGLAKPANSVIEHYLNTLSSCLPPFIELDDPAKALELAYGGMHTSTKLRLDAKKGSSRIELRMIDSLSPYRAIQALLLALGLIEGLRGQQLPSYEESVTNYISGRKGLRSTMRFFGRDVTARTLSSELINISREGLDKLGLKSLAQDLLLPLKVQVDIGRTQADDIRNSVMKLEMIGCTREEAIVVMLNDLNNTMFKGEL